VTQPSRGDLNQKLIHVLPTASLLWIPSPWIYSAAAAAGWPATPHCVSYIIVIIIIIIIFMLIPSSAAAAAWINDVIIR